MARAASRRMVFTMRGWAWPKALTAMPPRKSRYFLPVESYTYAPLPWVKTMGWRLWVGRRNCSASLRRVSSFGLRLGARLGFCIAGRAAFFLFRFAITPPRAPLAPPEETPEERECRGWRSRDRGRELGLAIRAAENRRSRHRRCGLRGRRLLEHAWRLRA